MARYQNGPLGGFSGKLGPIIGSTWRGTNVLRSLPISDTRTFSTKQLLQQQRLKVVQEFLGPIKGILSETFGSKTAKNPPYNNAMSYHMTDALLLTEYGWTIEYPKVLIAKGDLCGLEAAVLHQTSPGTLTLTWSDNSSQGLAYATDQLIVVAYCPQLKSFENYIDTYQRSDSSCQLVMPSSFSGLDVQFWASFYNESKQTAATSRYLGRVVL